jgi:hypothetical protein
MAPYPRDQVSTRPKRVGGEFKIGKLQQLIARG